MYHRITTTALTAIFFLVLAIPALAFDDPFVDSVYLLPSMSSEGAGFFDAELVYVPFNENTARLIVTITNYSSPMNGGYITGFAMNNPSDKISTVYPTDDSGFNEAFEVIGQDAPYNAVKAVPFGLFDFGAAIGGNFLGGGSPEDGLPADMGFESHMFAFNLTGDNLDTLTAEDFVNEPSKRKGGENVGVFAVRFKGFEDGSSDKVLAIDYYGGGIGE